MIQTCRQFASHGGQPLAWPDTSLAMPSQRSSCAPLENSPLEGHGGTNVRRSRLSTSSHALIRRKPANPIP